MAPVLKGLLWYSLLPVSFFPLPYDTQLLQVMISPLSEYLVAFHGAHGSLTENPSSRRCSCTRARTLIRRPMLVRRRSMQAPPLSSTTVRYVVDVDRHRILGSTPLTYMPSARSGSVRSSRIRKHIFTHRKSNSSTFRALVAQLGRLGSLEMANALRKYLKNELPHSKVGLPL